MMENNIRFVKIQIKQFKCNVLKEHVRQPVNCKNNNLIVEFKYNFQFSFIILIFRFVSTINASFSLFTLANLSHVLNSKSAIQIISKCISFCPNIYIIM